MLRPASVVTQKEPGSIRVPDQPVEARSPAKPPLTETPRNYRETSLEISALDGTLQRKAIGQRLRDAKAQYLETLGGSDLVASHERKARLTVMTGEK
jgi:hypothetical protein